MAIFSPACNSAKSATIYVPGGRYLIKAATFRGPCKNKITVKIDGTLVAPSDYYAFGNSGYWITVVGGTLDGNGAGFWACRKSGKNCLVGAKTDNSDQAIQAPYQKSQISHANMKSKSCDHQGQSVLQQVQEGSFDSFLELELESGSHISKGKNEVEKIMENNREVNLGTESSSVEGFTSRQNRTYDLENLKSGKIRREVATVAIVYFFKEPSP
ncbi:hypothetical protein RND71_032099 [Anisodus tanguticus]|uniref:Uncharacterized protein n=1 Tax=Anisodus tanguticus TaxID=243964 RepID=A0AAE1V5H6_9SOLA|nr:hypothetical protein RND71_032099 [Anisodus tanguticus]